METANSWLRANEYENIAQLIDEITPEWKKSGKNTAKLVGNTKCNKKAIQEG